MSGYPAFLRDLDGIQIVQIDPQKEVLDGPVSTQKGKVACWSPNGEMLAFVDPEGVKVLAMGASDVKTLPGSSKATVGLYWSPKGSTLVTVSLYQKGSSESNLQLWRKGEDGEFRCSSSFVHPKLEAKQQVVKWTAEEGLCARLLPEGTLELHKGSDISEEPLLFKFARAASEFDFAGHRLAVFVPDQRDDLQRVALGAQVAVWEISEDGLSKTETMKAEIESGQLAELKWCHSGSALLVHCTTEVDDTGKSYYGVSKLLLASADGGFQKDLTEAETTQQQQSVAVQAVEWSPTRDEFILIRGYQPAKVMLWQWDKEAQTLTLAKILTEKAHRNFIRFNHFGSLVCIAGFGNLAGEVDFYGRSSEQCDFTRISKCEANCTVSADWAPDGRHLLTAVLFPRMRVDNGLTLWNALTGTKVVSSGSEQLYEAAWRPGRLSELDVSPEEVAKGMAATVEGGKKQAYKPPKARGGGDSQVAAMMRGDVAVPEEDRRRRPWQEKEKEKEKRKDAERSSPRSPPQSPSSEATGKLSPPFSPPRKPKDPKESFSPPLSRQSSHMEGRASPSRVSPQLGPQAELNPPEAMELERPQSPEQSFAAALAAHGAQQGGADQLAALFNAAEEQRQLQRLQQQKLKAQLTHLTQLRDQQLLQAAALGQAGAGAGLQDQQLQQAIQVALQQQQRQQQVQQATQQRILQQQLATMMRDPTMAAALSAAGCGGAAGHTPARVAQAQLEQQRQLASAMQEEQLQRMERAAAVGSEKPRRCPTHGWQYIDPKGNVQGPFSLQEMQTWHKMGFFQPDLRMRCDPADKFIALKDLFPNGTAFESYPRRIPAGNGYAGAQL